MKSTAIYPALLLAAMTMFWQAPAHVNASADHIVITNNFNGSGPNTGTVFSLGGTNLNPTLREKGTLNTGISMTNTAVSPAVAVSSHGADICVYLSNPLVDGNEISAFVYPSLSPVGNYNDPTITNSGIGIILFARGNYLFGGYGNNDSYVGYLAVWRIRSGCTLELLSTFTTIYPINGLAVTPDGKTLVNTYLEENGEFDGVDSFSISGSGQLTEHGPYGINGQFLYDGAGVDMTADSKYALVAGTGGDTGILIYAINSDGSLGQQYDYGGDGGLGPGISTQSIRVSPDEKFIFVNDGTGSHITTVNFTETSNPISVQYNGCYTTVRTPIGEKIVDGFGLTTAFPTGSGQALYLYENFNFASVALLTIDPTTGCTTEAPASPFKIGTDLGYGSVASWPPRPF